MTSMTSHAEKMAGVYRRLYGDVGTAQWRESLQRTARSIHNRRRREILAAEGRDIGGYRPRKVSPGDR